MTISSVPAGYHAHEDTAGAAGSSDPEDARALRRRALDQLAIIGTPAEERFDRLTRLARQVLGVPICNITLLDGDDLFIKSLGGSEAAVTIPAEQSFCETGVKLGAPLIVVDASSDDRFSHLDAVVGPDHVRSYAGVPLTDDNGIAVGMFCVADTEAREFSGAELGVLDELTRMAQDELHTSAETNRARAVQQRLLPRRLPRLPGYEIAALCTPTHSVGGDFYDFGATPTGLGLVLADVMGKGTAAAIVSATVRAAIQSALRANLSAVRNLDTVDPAKVVADVVTSTARTLSRDLDETGTLATAFMGHLDPSSHTLTWVDAGHGLAVVIGADGREDTWLAWSDLPLGVDPGAVWHGRSTAIGPGDTLLVFSDGLLDLFGGTAVALHEIAELARTAGSPDRIVDDVRTLTRMGVPTDDVTVLAVRRTA